MTVRACADNATNGACWTDAEKRHVATIDSYKDVAHKNEAQLQAAVMLNPVSIAIEVRTCARVRLPRAIGLR